MGKHRRKESSSVVLANAQEESVLEHRKSKHQLAVGTQEYKKLARRPGTAWVVFDQCAYGGHNVKATINHQSGFPLEQLVEYEVKPMLLISNVVKDVKCKTDTIMIPAFHQISLH